MSVNDDGAVAHQRESNCTRRAWPGFRFRLRTLLALPVVAAALLLIAFPKLLTGDFVEATVVSIEKNGGRVRIEMDARISSGTGWGTTIFPGGGFGTSGVSSKSRPHWTRIIPAWPKHESLIISLGIRDQPSAALKDPIDMLTIKRGESYRVLPGQPLELARKSCQMKVSRGSRLGL